MIKFRDLMFPFPGLLHVPLSPVRKLRLENNLLTELKQDETVKYTNSVIFGHCGALSLFFLDSDVGKKNGV
ncbi:hypothetical protein C9I36_02860 [Pectobacterium punjabense]|nr:hypothetical protein [Pectobacterium sp. IFB5596]PTA65671.1 hypothetical protein C9I36_02860 [Pectobacterium punjabense]